MTPPAATAAGGRATAKAAPDRRRVRSRPAPSPPRRVSGPVRSRAQRPRIAGPAPRALELIRGLPDHPLLDRLVRGRSWIPVLGVMLAGIVAMQVEVLKLNASIGRSLTLSSTLQSRNEQLRASVSSLSDAQRIEHLASHMGMVMTGPTSLDFLDPAHANAGQAAGSIHSPDAAAFASALQASELQAEATSAPTVPPATVSTSTAAGTSTSTSRTTTTPTSPSTTATTTSGTSGPGGTTTGSQSAPTAPTTSATTGGSPATTGGSPATTGGAPATTGGAAPAP